MLSDEISYSYIQIHVSSADTSILPSLYLLPQLDSRKSCATTHVYLLEFYLALGTNVMVWYLCNVKANSCLSIAQSMEVLDLVDICV